MRDLLARVIARDPSVAGDLEAMAQKLLALAAQIRGGTRDSGSMADRVQMAVVGPDGKIKQTSDTL